MSQENNFYSHGLITVYHSAIVVHCVRVTLSHPNKSQAQPSLARTLSSGVNGMRSPTLRTPALVTGERGSLGAEIRGDAAGHQGFAENAYINEG